MEVVSNGDELLDVLDGDGNFTGRKPRSLVHRDHDRHGLVFVWSAWVRGGRGVMVLQRRGRSGDPYAAHIDALAGGHIGAGETPVEAALRELEEEAGVAASAHDFVRLGSSRMDRPTGDCRKVVQHLLLYPLPLEQFGLTVTAVRRKMVSERVRVLVSRCSAFYTPLIVTISGRFIREEGLAPPTL